MSDKYAKMRHALGVAMYHGRRWSKPYRNHYVAGDAAVAHWEELVADGFATKRAGHPVLTDGHPTYFVTDAGRVAALEGLVFKRRWGYGTPVNGGVDG